MYRSGAKEGLSRAELEAARLGFLGYLRRKRFSPQFIARNAEDLFAQAALEYSRKFAEGVEIENPPGWLIECAWRRTKSQLEAEKSSPRVVSTEKSGPLADEPGHDPEDVLLDEDRFRKLREAVGELSADQRRLLAVSYFEGFTVREAARRLRWHPSKAQRAHEGAKERLHELLGVDSLDELEIEIGLAAYLSIATGASSDLQVRAGVEAAAEMAGRGAADLWARAQELARRFPLGGAEPSTTAALGGTAGRAAGACATAAAACLAASGVVGPGLGGVDLIGRDKANPAKSRDSAIATDRPPAPRLPAAPASGKPSPPTGPSPRPRAPRAKAQASAQQRRQRATREATEQFAVESAADEEAGGASAEPSSAEAPAPEASAPSSSSTSASSPTATEVANEQFGPGP